MYRGYFRIMENVKNKKILVIEDDDLVRDGVVELLSEEGFQMFNADNGLDGLRLAQKVLPDLIICDIMMPGLNGYQVLDALQQDQETALIPFIFLTAKSDRSDFRLSMQLGADDFITKPFRSEELKHAVMTRLSKVIKQEIKSQEKLERFKFNIASFLPHEMRTPLNGILASTQMLLEYKETMDAAEIQQLLENIFNAAKRLNHTIENYLYYSELTLLRADNKRLIYFIKNEYCNDPATEIAEVAKTIAKNYNRTEDLYLSLHSIPIKICKEHFNKILYELFDNAFKFSFKGNKVITKSSITNDSYIIDIIDNGIGIAPSYLKKISAFEQFDRNIYEQQGSGLGFIISKYLIEIYKGNLKVESEQNNFTKITISFPKT